MFHLSLQLWTTSDRSCRYGDRAYYVANDVAILHRRAGSSRYGEWRPAPEARPCSEAGSIMSWRKWRPRSLLEEILYYINWFLWGCSHFAVTHISWVWKALDIIHDSFTGVSIHVWIHEVCQAREGVSSNVFYLRIFVLLQLLLLLQHVLGHHCYTNIDPVDPDVFSLNVSLDTVWRSGFYYRLIPSPPILQEPRRLHTREKWYPFHFYQHIYLPFLYSLVSVIHFS